MFARRREIRRDASYSYACDGFWRWAARWRSRRKYRGTELSGSPVTTAHQSQYLAEIINRWHAGRAKYLEIPGMSHDFNRYNGMRDFLDRAATGGDGFHTGLLDAVFGWLDALN